MITFKSLTRNFLVCLLLLPTIFQAYADSLISIENNIISSNTEFQVNVTGLSNDQDWVGIYNKEDDNTWGNVVSWSWVHSGNNSLEGISSTGEYEARLFFHNSFNDEARVAFTVESENPATIQINNEFVSPNVQLDVQVSGLSNDQDWVGIYQKEDTNDWGNVVSWSWVHSGNNSLEGIPSTGEYEARLFFHNSFNDEARVAFTVESENPVTILINNGHISPNVQLDIQVSGLSNEQDWIGIYRKGDTNDWENVVSWSWANSNNIVLDGISDAGEYEARLFFHNSYIDEARTAFSVDGYIGTPGEHGSVVGDDTFEYELSNGESINKKITWYRPDDLSVANKSPALLFAPGGLDTDNSHTRYSNLLSFIASQGYVVYYVSHSYQRGKLIPEETYKGFKAAIDRHAAWLDRTQIGMIGFSSGAGALISTGYKLFNNQDYDYGSNGRFLFQLSPNIAHGVEEGDIENYPENTKLLTQIYDHSLEGPYDNAYEYESENDPRTFIDIYNNISINSDNKEFVIIRSDTLEAKHRTPLSSDAEFDNLDTYAIFRPLQALADATFNNNENAKVVALGNGLSNVANGIRIIHSDNPTSLFIEEFGAIKPSNQYAYRCDNGETGYSRVTQCNSTQVD